MATAAVMLAVELMRAVGVAVADARLDVSFGQGRNAWHNYASSELQARLRHETRRFGVALRWISRLE